MRKITIAIIIIGIILGFFVGLYLYKTNSIENKISEEGFLNTNNVIAKTKEPTEERLVNNTETRITPSTKITEKVYYKNCNHLITTIKAAEAELVNLNEAELTKKIPNCEIQKFTKEEVIIYKEEDDFCNEHYLLKDKDGYVEIYMLDQQGNISKTLERTEISTELLPEKDKIRLKEGINIYTKKELNRQIEDFE